MAPPNTPGNEASPGNEGILPSAKASRPRSRLLQASETSPGNEGILPSSADSPALAERQHALPPNALIQFLLGLGDDAMVLGQRLSEWSGKAPFLEEDLALANVALDYIGRADLFYRYASELEGARRSADEIAFLRDSREYRNLLICELPVGDFAFTMARQAMADAFNRAYLERLARSSDLRIAAIAAKAVKESRYHLQRSREWVLRLGDGTEESHEKIQRAFNALWGYAPEMFLMTAVETALLESGVSVDRAALQSEWEAQMAALFAEATLTLPAAEWSISGGRDGVHTEFHGRMLAEMQFMQRAYPGLDW